MVLNVGVIFYDPALTPLLQRKLREQLAALQRRRAVIRVLHHGGGQGADDAALRVVRDLGGWQDRAHRDGDTAIAGASGILIAVGPRPEQNADGSPRAAAWRNAIQHARVTHVTIVYVQETGHRNQADMPEKAPRRQPKRAPAARNVPAARSTRSSSAGGRPAGSSHACRRCRQPVPASRERWGWLCEDCERRPRRVYVDARDPRVRVPPSKSVRAVSAGLPGLGKRS